MMIPDKESYFVWIFFFVLILEFMFVKYRGVFPLSLGFVVILFALPMICE